MKVWKTTILFFLFVGLFLSCVPGAPVTPETRQRIRAMCDTIEIIYINNTPQEMAPLLDEHFGLVHMGAGKQDILKSLEMELNLKIITGYQIEIRDIQREGEYILVRTREVEKRQGATGKKEEEIYLNIYFLVERNGGLFIRNISRDIKEGEFDPQTRIYHSRKANFTIRAPQGWFAVKPLAGLDEIAMDSVHIMAPDLKSCLTLGMVRIPILLDPDRMAQQALEADLAITGRMVEDFQKIRAGEIQVGGIKGYYSLNQFSYKGFARTRNRIYLFQKPFLYFFICDAFPPENYTRLEPLFGEVFNSLKIIPPEEGGSIEDKMVSELARGGISGRVYTSEEFNCFIAAPQGWEIRTSPNPVHLVEMQYKKGRSFARLISAKNLPARLTLKELTENRMEACRKLLADFKEIQRNEISIQGVPAMESFQSYSLESVGTFQVREVTVMKGGIVYLIICQAIEPDNYEILKGDFEKIVRSFGFIR